MITQESESMPQTSTDKTLQEILQRITKIEEFQQRIDVRERNNLLKCFESTLKDRKSFRTVLGNLGTKLAVVKERLNKIEERLMQDEAKAHRISLNLRKASVAPSDVVRMKKTLGDLAVMCDGGHRKTPPSTLISQHVSDFYSNISIPGVKYCMEQNRHSFERYLWMVVLLFSLLVSSRFIQEAYVKWQGSPTLLSFNDSMTPVGQLPFPAVTICAPGQMDLGYLLDDHLQDCDWPCSLVECNKLLAARLLCPHSQMFPKKCDKPHLHGSVYSFVKNISSPCESFVVANNLTFNRQQLSCRSTLQTVFVDGKVCHTFNMLSAADIFHKDVVAPMVQHTADSSQTNWTLESTLESATPPDSVPRYSNSSGRWDGLSVLLDLGPALNISEVDSGNSACQFPNTHTKIALHSPGEFPTPETHTFLRLESGRMNVLRVTPHLVTAQSELLEYQPAKRKCFFSTEQTLSLFRVYTKRNCLLECKANCSLSLCGCVPFYLPRANSSVKVCGHESRCGNGDRGAPDPRFPWNLQKSFSIELSLHVDEFFDKSGIPPMMSSESTENNTNCTLTADDAKMFGLQGVHSGVLDEQDTPPLRTGTPPECSCDCRADCVTLSYSVILEDQPVDDPKVPNSSSLLLAISYRESEFTSTVRKELIGFTDFIANSGGVLGVFTGFSFLALAELLYYLTFRLWSTVKQSWEAEAEDIPAGASRSKVTDEAGSSNTTEIF